MSKKRIISRRPRFVGIYPNAVGSRSGLRVGWETFNTLEEATRVSKWAILASEWDMDHGYDFGSIHPGMIIETADGTFEVCIP